jgi:hypothetical protein
MHLARGASETGTGKTGSVATITANPARRATRPILSKAWFILPAILLIIGAAALSASYIPYNVLAVRVRAVSMSGQANFFDATFFHAIQFRLRIIGLLNLLGAATALAFRKRIRQAAGQIAQDFPQLRTDIKSAAAATPFADRIGLTILVLAAFCLRIKLLFAPMRSDEAYSFIEYASHPFYVALSFYNSPNNHAFHTFLMRCVYLVFGNHPWALRLPAFVFGLCLVPAGYMASRSLYKTSSGLLAAAMIAASSPLIDYSTNARGYIILCVVTLLSICASAHALRTRNWASWFILAILAALGFYTIPIMLYPFGGIVLWILLCSLSSEAQNRREILAGLCFACIFGGILTLELYSPIFAVSGPSAITGNTWVKPARWAVFLRDLPPSFAPTWKQWNTDVPQILLWMLVIGFFTSLLFQRRCGRERIALPIAMVACSLALIVLQRVVFFERLWLFALPIYFVAAAAGIALILEFLRARSPYVAALAAIAIALFMGVTGLRSQSAYLSNEGRGFEQLAIYAKSELKPGDNVISVMGCEAAAQYYFQLYHVPLSYLNAPGGEHVMMVVNPIAINESKMQLMLTYAKRSDLDPNDARLVKTFDSLQLFEFQKKEFSKK